MLEQIIAHKRSEIEQLKNQKPLLTLKAQCIDLPPCRGFVAAVCRESKQNVAVIAELKKGSPSCGIICADYHPQAIASYYAQGGATCLSVLTDKQFFYGDEAHLREVHSTCHLPILRKDFIIDPYQLYETRAMGADCALLIAAILPGDLLPAMVAIAREIDLDIIIEVHCADELAAALETETLLIGINNRNLHTFKTDIATTLSLSKSIPADRVAICESGVNSAQIVQQMYAHNVRAFLVGEALMRTERPDKRLQELFFTQSNHSEGGEYG